MTQIGRLIYFTSLIGLASCAAQTTEEGGRSSNSSGASSGMTGAGLSQGGGIAAGGAATGGITSGGSMATGGFETGGTSSGGTPATGGSGTGGMTNVPCECNSSTGTAVGTTCGNPSSQLDFESGTEGAGTYSAVIDTSSGQSCGDQVQCGSASLMMCANFNPAINDFSPNSTQNDDIIFNVNSPPDWKGKKVTAFVYLDGQEALLGSLRIQLRIGSHRDETNAKFAGGSISVSGPAAVGAWHEISGTVTTAPTANHSRLSILFRRNSNEPVEWQGSIFVDHITWE